MSCMHDIKLGIPTKKTMLQQRNSLILSGFFVKIKSFFIEWCSNNRMDINWSKIFIMIVT